MKKKRKGGRQSIRGLWKARMYCTGKRMYRYSLKHGTLAEKREAVAFEDVKELIYPRLEARSRLTDHMMKHEYDAAQQKICLKEKEGAFSHIPSGFLKDFEITYIIDWSGPFPQMPLVDDVTEEHLKLWRITREELHRTAMDNLSKNRLHIRYVIKNHVPWDDVLVDSISGMNIYQLSFDSGILDSYAYDILLFGKQLREIERMLDHPYYLVLCEPYPLLIPYDPFKRDVDFEKIYRAIGRSSFAPDRLVSGEVYLFERGMLRKSGNRIRQS